MMKSRRDARRRQLRRHRAHRVGLPDSSEYPTCYAEPCERRGAKDGAMKWNARTHAKGALRRAVVKGRM